MTEKLVVPDIGDFEDVEVIEVLVKEGDQIKVNDPVVTIESDKFEQISIKPGFMKHNGGVLFRTISETEYEFKSTINENHLNAAGITHGGYLSALIDAGAGTSAHRAANGSPCVTISLDLKFIGASKVGDEITGFTKILKKTNTLIFLFCELKCNDKIITSGSGVWKILKIK